MTKSWIAPILLLVLGGGVAFAQAGPPKAAPRAAPAAPSSASGQGMMGQGMMGHGMMSGDMMGSGMMDNCSCANAAGIRVDVKKIAKGVTITYTSEDASAVARLQKRADAVRLMHESCSQ